MNDAHLHMVVNHFPIIGLILGLGILLFGVVLKNKSLINTAYGLFIVAAIFAIASMSTGEGAEELVEEMPNVGKRIIHEHEEIAEKLAIVLYVLGAISIAGLYLNRINQGIKLQSDPTFKFCWGDQLIGVQRLLNIHREIDCPYNTYRINGLPPGPICIPSTIVVDAVLNRADVNYIFMCAKPDYSGRHNFAVSGEDHTKNASIFQKWLASELKKNGN